MSNLSTRIKFLLDLANECERSHQPFGQGRAYGIRETYDEFRDELAQLADPAAEIAALRNYVGTNHLRSDYQNADQMRAEIDALRKEVAKYKAMYMEQNDTSNKLADRIIENHETIFRLRDMVAAAVVARDRLRKCPNTSTGAGGQTIDECVARRRYFNVPLAIFDEFGTLLGDMSTELYEQIEKAAEKLTTPGATS